MPSSATPTELPSLAPGTLVAGKLRVVRTMGVGGMGTVYEVEHVLTKHHRALKILHAGASPSVVERFVREASAAARIGNPHVAETFDAGTLEEGEPYLVMELLDGETLDERLRRSGPIDPGELSDLIYQACEGIQAAHDAGIVHRDLKPENLFVTVRNGEPFVKILDFGISKFDEGRTGALGITEEGSVMGTPYYMSPEQVIASGSIDLRTDIYALGVMLYECACGERPYDASYLGQLAVLIHEGKATPLAERRPSLPPAFCEIVHRAMAADRNLRFESAHALAEALAPLRVRTYFAAVPNQANSSAPPPRVVVRPSTRPFGQSGEAPPVSSTVPSGSSAASALAVTPATHRPPPPARRSVVLPVVGVALFVAAAGGVFAFARSPKAPSAPAASSGPNGAASEELPAPSAVLAPLPTPVASGSASASAATPVAPPRGPQSAVVATSGAPVRPEATPHPSARPGAAPPPPSSPSATATASSRVDQKGLAGENPFR